MDGKGRALDNIFTEQLWGTVKHKDVYLNDLMASQSSTYGSHLLP